MDLGLNGKTALVLGASRGLGKAVALSLLAEGATVCAAARDIAHIEAWRSALPEAQAARLHPCALDLSDLASVTHLIDTVKDRFDIDILVLNGGGPPPSRAVDVTLETWMAQYPPMAAHLFHVASAFLPAMRTRGWGRILTIASSGVEQPIPNLAISNALRASVAGWSKTLATEVAADGVTVNMVLPGRIHTDRVNAIDDRAAERDGLSRADIAARSHKEIPMGRYGTPEEFADMVVFLASTRASYVTGTQMRVDGGVIRSVG